MNRALRTEVVLETPWMTVVSTPMPDGQPYYMVELTDYVTVVAVTGDGRVLTVRQYRPVVDQDTLELPSGNVDAGETPEAAARRELLEETGYVAERFELLGTLLPDVGRLRNRLWCFHAADATPDPAGATPETGLTVDAVPAAELVTLTTNGTIDHALGLAAVFLAVARGKLPFSRSSTGISS